MGACVSRPENCVGGKFGISRKKKGRKRRKGLQRRITADLSDRSSDRVEKVSPLPVDRPFSNPTVHGSVEEAWFDSAVDLESDCSDEDFQSLPDDVIYLSGIDGTNESEGNLVNEAAKSSVVLPSFSDTTPKPNKPTSDACRPVFLDEISGSAEENVARDNSLLDNCIGILPNNCLPCLASTVVPVEKRRSLVSGPRKKAALKLSFKWKDEHSTTTLISSKALLQRPIAGSQVPFCPLGKRMPDSWSEIEPGTFKVRGVNYFRDKKKELAHNCAAYNPFGLDVFLSQRKINHITRFVELPVVSSSGKLPPILVVNIQMPLYPAAIFQGETDGEGISFVLYFKLSESFSKEISARFQDNIRKLIDDEVEKVKGFAVDTVAPFRERLKILGRVSNMEDLPLSAAERKLMHAYNEKPVLSRPQHQFYSGNKAEELPEQILCCIRLNEIDYVNYQQLVFS
ncbi:hypothetical protein PHJA_001300700 [Phtheirospermum japonicum]|uniref:Protein ENHANCED DISEASE RESISTANCE 2 C-terminal domain-containing protein n=1 Tax=Phtheirospermum japonicum TaxID=374723 RepID=A0A830BUB5_9LAMI|nr:hypothetical protein PHJA_001300700 [Phtheirospermum japonicum]